MLTYCQGPCCGNAGAQPLNSKFNQCESSTPDRAFTNITSPKEYCVSETRSVCTWFCPKHTLHVSLWSETIRFVKELYTRFRSDVYLWDTGAYLDRVGGPLCEMRLITVEEA